jgi:hypothetical protein
VAMGWLGQSGRRDGSGRRKAPNRAGERDNGEATGQAVAGGDRVAGPVTGARKALTSGARLPERERARGVRLTGGAGLAAQRGGERGCAGDGPLGPRKGGECGRARERGGFGPKMAQPRGVSFFFFLFSIFYFLFLISISFISFSFEQIIS